MCKEYIYNQIDGSFEGKAVKAQRTQVGVWIASVDAQVRCDEEM